MSTLIGPFAQILPLDDLPVKGALSDEQLAIYEQAGVVVFGGKVQEIGPFHQLSKKAEAEGWTTVIQEEELVLLPGFVDCHTHICFAGERAGDYALRNQGLSYLEIAREGGGIWSTVTHTREADENQLVEGLRDRADSLFRQGITTIEV
jgi:imidazolonepropionase